MSRRQKRSPQDMKYEDSLNCDHTVYSSHTDAIHRLYHFFAGPVGQKFRFGYPWDRMSIVANLFAKKQPFSTNNSP